ncbi:MAG: pantoate kinase [Halodesulfurarchaeum sp.]
MATTAWVPGHVTGLFTVDRADDPARTGSRGAGFTLADGVSVTVRPDRPRQVVLDGEPADVAAVERVLETLDVRATVEATTELPVGRGFGLSGAMALGTALAANEAVGLGRSENELIRVAHAADVAAGTGLGDVVAQARGGMVLRMEAGAPPHGRLDGIPVGGRVELLALGELSTPSILEERPDRITAAGERALERLQRTPTREAFVRASRDFTEAVGLATDEVAEILESVTRNGDGAAMAMLGETVFGFGTPLSDAGYDPRVSAIDSCGPRRPE